MMIDYPTLQCADPHVAVTWRIAFGDMLGNIRPYQSGMLESPRPVILAGLDYDTPWTRDAAINVWNGMGLIFPQVARDTLISMLERHDNGLFISGQYWDAMIWTVGAWHYYLYTGDLDFLKLALEAVTNSLRYFEATEFSSDWGLFRGPAVYGDGVSAYPDRYAQTNGSSSILDWPAHNPADRAATGVGISMHALSTNGVYYQAYRLAEQMANELNEPIDSTWPKKAEALKEAINHHFWQSDRGAYRYLVDAQGGCDHQEGLGHSFALLFGIANEAQAEQIMHNLHIAPAGIPCVYPSYPRYQQRNPHAYGRHSGTVWPHIQSFWAQAAARYGRVDAVDHELRVLVNHVNRDAQFTEIYHPTSGLPYGGLQEGGTGPDALDWASCRRQTWSASGFIGMLLHAVMGMRFEPDGIRFAPCVTQELIPLEISGLSYRGNRLTIRLEGEGTTLAEIKVNGQTVSHLPSNMGKDAVLLLRLR